MTELSPVRKWSILLVLSLALAIIILDTTLLNVSLSAIIKDLSTTIQGIQWVISGYALTLAALTIAGGRFGDLFGRKRMFNVGAIIFAIGSFVTSISHNVPTMIIGEAIIEGIGAALMMPATSSILVSIFKGRDRAIGFGVWGAVAGAAAALGPILGGYLTTHFSWRYGFQLNIIVAILLVFGSTIIPETRDTKDKPTIDWIGILLSSAGLLAFIYGVIESSTYGWWTAKEVATIFGLTLDFGTLSIVPVAILVGLIFLGFFVAWELRMERLKQTPLVSMKLFANRQFTSGAFLTGVLSLGQSGVIFAIPVFLQSVHNLDAFHTGLSLLPMSLTLLVTAPLGAAFSHRFSPRLMIQAGLLVNVVAVIVLRQTFSVDAGAWNFAPGLALFGLGFGLIMSQISNYTLSAVSPQEAGEASGVNNTARQIGSALGSAVIGAVLLGALANNLSTGIENSAVIPTPLKSTLAEAVSQQTSDVEFGGGAKAANGLPAPITEELTQIGHQATVDADKAAMSYGILFAILGFLVSFQLPNVKNVETGKAVAGH